MASSKNIGMILVLGAFLVLAFFVAFFGFGLQVHAPVVEEITERGEVVSGEIEVTGTSICLPHANPGEFETMECAFGIEANGVNYAVDLQNLTSVDYQTGVPTTVKGLFTPVEMLSSDHWQNYDIQGVITLTDLGQSSN